MALLLVSCSSLQELESEACLSRIKECRDLLNGDYEDCTIYFYFSDCLNKIKNETVCLKSPSFHFSLDAVEHFLKVCQKPNHLPIVLPFNNVSDGVKPKGSFIGNGRRPPPSVVEPFMDYSTCLLRRNSKYHLCSIVNSHAHMLCLSDWFIDSLNPPSDVVVGAAADADVDGNANSFNDALLNPFLVPGKIQLTNCSTWATFPMINSPFLTVQVTVSPKGIDTISIVIRTNHMCLSKHASQVLMLNARQSVEVNKVFLANGIVASSLPPSVQLYNGAEPSSSSSSSSSKMPPDDADDNVDDKSTTVELLSIRLEHLSTEIHIRRYNNDFFTISIKIPSQLFDKSTDDDFDWPNIYAAPSGCDSGCSPLQWIVSKSSRHSGGDSGGGRSGSRSLERYHRLVACQRHGLTGVFLDLCVDGVENADSFLSRMALNDVQKDLETMFQYHPVLRLLELNRTHTKFHTSSSSSSSSLSSSSSASTLFTTRMSFIFLIFILQVTCPVQRSNVNFITFLY